MPDTTARNPELPRDWSDAFNAMPLEAPPRDAWSRLAPRLGPQRRPRHLPAWLGLAAAAAVVAVIAWPRTDPIAQVVGATQVATASTEEATTSPGPSLTPSLVGATEVATAPSLVGATEVATEDPPQQEGMGEPSKALAASAAPTGTPASMARLYELQQESARLEALLAVARDDRVGSASAMLLADAFEAQVAGIDAALTGADLSDEAREQLWQARVDALQQAAGFVGTQRLMAAQGQTDVLLVSID